MGRVPLEELIALYQRAALVVVPSRYEGFGLPAVEAMACETPVIACSGGALPEVVGTAGGGLLAPCDNADALAQSIRALLEKPDQRRALGQAGRRGVKAAYAWPQVAARTAEIYGELLEERRGRPARTTTSARPGNFRASASSPTSNR